MTQDLLLESQTLYAQAKHATAVAFHPAKRFFSF